LQGVDCPAARCFICNRIGALPMSIQSAGAAEPTPTGEDLLRGLSQRLRRERHRLGLSQFAFAESIGITERAVRNYETGSNAIRMDILYRMLDAGVDLRFVLFGDREAVPGARSGDAVSAD
jgi:hypothetical protein